MFIRKGNPTCEPYGISTIKNKMMNPLIQARTKSKKYHSFFSNSVIMSSLTS